MLISLDTETTGVDLYHGCRPFLVTTCDEDGVVYWEWEVNPLTRKPTIPKGDLSDISDRINEASGVVGQNIKFDISALRSIGIPWRKEWYAKTQDTLLAGHLLASSEPHDLTTMALRYLRIDIEPEEKALRAAVNEIRAIARRELPTWVIAAEGEEGMPSAKGSLGCWDYWLPAAYAKAKGLPADHRYREVCREYANSDSSVTLALWKRMLELLEERELLRMYSHRRQLIEVIVKMEEQGITYSDSRLSEIYDKFVGEAQAAEKHCVNLSGKKLEGLPKSGTTKLMREVLFKDFRLPVVSKSEKTGEPSVDKLALRTWKGTLPENSRPHEFVKSLLVYRSRTTACNYMDGYRRFGIEDGEGWYRLHSSYNPTGSDTLRFSCSNPNAENISKQDETNLRYAFGPLPGREWWSLDYSNIELRIPAYESGEEEMIALFERPDDPPYFGSQHLLISHILWPKEFEACLKAGEAFNKKYKATLYQWTKNGDFAVTYGAMEESGTADRAYHQVGAQRKIMSRFKKIDGLNRSLIAFAREHGYVLTMEDKEYGSYPIQTPRTRWGDIRPTTPLNYHSQGTAMQAMCRAMVRCYDYLATLRCHYLVAQIHDELVFDFPKGKTPRANLPHVLKLKSLMEESGGDIGIPLRVDYSYYPLNWAKSEEIAV